MTTFLLPPVIQLYSKRTYVAPASSYLVMYSAISLLETLRLWADWEVYDADLPLEMRLELELT